MKYTFLRPDCTSNIQNPIDLGGNMGREGEISQEILCFDHAYTNRILDGGSHGYSMVSRTYGKNSARIKRGFALIGFSCGGGRRPVTEKQPQSGFAGSFTKEILCSAIKQSRPCPE